LKKLRKKWFIGGCEGSAGRDGGDLRKWNQVEQMRLMRTKSGRPIGRHEINETFKLSYNDYINI